MIVDCAVYEQGRRRAGELPLEDACEAHQRPKVEAYGDALMVVVKTAHHVDREDVVVVGELIVFVNRAFVITVRHGEGALSAVRERLERRPDLLALGSMGVLYAILDRVVDDYEVAAEAVETYLQEVEADVFSPDRSNPAERIYGLEREVLEFHRAVVPLQPAVEQLARGHFDAVPPALRDYFRDVCDHLARVAGRVGGFRELLTSALHANLTQVAVRQNEDMRRISAWVAILAVPTMIAGLYGMNFDTMPELRFTYGYPLVLGVIATACTLLYLRFKRSGWL